MEAAVVLPFTMDLAKLAPEDFVDEEDFFNCHSEWLWPQGICSSRENSRFLKTKVFRNDMELIDKRSRRNLSKSRNSAPGGFVSNPLPGFFYVAVRGIRLPDTKAQR